MAAGGSLARPPRRPMPTPTPAGVAARPKPEPLPNPLGSEAFRRVGSRVRITGMKVFGVSLTPDSDRPYVFVKLETDAGLVGWGEGTLEGKAGAVIACMNDFRDFLIGADPVLVEHHWQSMYVHSFYRAGPVIGSAISGIDQALWDLRGKLFGLPVYRLLGGPFDARGVRGYYHAQARDRAQLEQLRDSAVQLGRDLLQGTVFPAITSGSPPRARIAEAVAHVRLLREGLGPDIDIGIDFHAKTSPAVASVLFRELEPLNLLFIEEPCPPENVQAMARIARRSTIPIATGERLIASYSVPRIDRDGGRRHPPDRHQPRGRHHRPLEGRAPWPTPRASRWRRTPARVRSAAWRPCMSMRRLPNFLVQEICSGVAPGPKEKVWEEWLGFPAMRMVDGRFPLPEQPGLGFDLTEDALKQIPLRRHPAHGPGLLRRRLGRRLVG